MSDEQPPWIDYKVGEPSKTENYTSNNCCPMSMIYHITHIENSISILKHGKILPQLVYDKSLLNQDRILVSWLSPNHWWKGSRYGNVCFGFHFGDIIEGRSAYWVESMKDYDPYALRILLTKQDRTSDPRLRRYSPEDKSGPWWYDRISGNHYRNGNYTLEFMLEEEIMVSAAASISFEKHHEYACCVDPSTCADKNMDSRSAAGIFGAGVAINGIGCQTLPISGDSCGEVVDTILRFYHWSSNKEFTGRGNSPAVEQALAHAWLSACFYRRPEEQRTIVLLFESNDKFYEAVTSALIKTFGEIMRDQVNLSQTG